MKKFGFRYINDKTKETINKKSFDDIDQAIEYFAEIKKLSVTNFLKIYKVFEINGN
ncbi:MAG: hypothetical protein AABY22_19675 [Nanoarchaeota archaeon]